MVELFGLIDIQTISMASAAIGVLAGVINWIVRTRRAEKQRQTEIDTRQAELFMGLFSYMLDPEIYEMYRDVQYGWQWEDYDDYLRKFVGTDESVKRVMMFRYLEGIGVLIYRGLLDANLVNDLMGPAVTMMWEKYEPIIVRRRVDLNWPDFMQGWEYLYDRLKPMERSFES